ACDATVRVLLGTERDATEVAQHRIHEAPARLEQLLKADDRRIVLQPVAAQNDVHGVARRKAQLCAPRHHILVVDTRSARNDVLAIRIVRGAHYGYAGRDTIIDQRPAQITFDLTSIVIAHLAAHANPQVVVGLA